MGMRPLILIVASVATSSTFLLRNSNAFNPSPSSYIKIPLGTSSRSSRSSGASSQFRPQSQSQSQSQPRLSSLSLSLKRKLVSEDDLAKPPNQKVIEAIESSLSSSSSSSPAIIASDIAAKTGLSLSETKQSLSAIASLTRGDISVTNDGELLYSFPSSNIQSILRSNSLRYKVTNTWVEDVWPKLFWGIRISFGVFLFVSIAAIFSTLIFIQSGGGNSDDDRDNGNGNNQRGGGGGMFRYGFGDFMFDIFYPRPYLYSYNYGYYGRYDPYYTTIEDTREQDENEKKGGIFEGIFSYIFGDGNPNRNLEAARLREASRIIRSNGGAVTAEQLAPFCDVDDPDDIMRDDFSISDESFVLPIVSQLGGEPTVTDDGDIIYLFPDLQVSTTTEEDEINMNLKSRYGASENTNMEYLQEMSLEFNRNEGFGNIAAGALGVVNLGGALYLGQLLSSPAMAGVQMAGFFGLVQAGYPLLVIYALLFNTIPAVRYLYNQKKNDDIKNRNSARRKWSTYLQVGGGTSITRKLKAAKSFRQRMRRLVGGKEDTIYDTRTKIEDLTTEKETRDMKRFDELLSEDDNLGSFQ